jgi:uncharacterized protein (DUF362 family)
MINAFDSVARVSRRQFLLRAAKAAAALAAMGAGIFHARQSARPRQSNTSAAPWPSFAGDNNEPQLAIATGEARASMLRAALFALGGIERFIHAGDRVLIKVNAAFAAPPALGATTHPDLVAEMVRLCLRAGAAEAVVTDYPINDINACFRFTEIAAAAEAAGGKVHFPSPRDFEPLLSDQAQLLQNWPVLMVPLRRATKLIGLAPVKDHARSGASMTLKNWYGFVGGSRALFHQQVHELISELALLFRPTFVVLDGTVTMFRNGPTGGSLSDLKPTRRMIVSTDSVAADAFGATLLGRKPSEIPFITKAAAAGAGTANYELLNPIYVNAS